ncbi:MAG: efflux RND transporter periplasmic adaptor subunit [Bacteroidetes bacterium]|nr:efflux RND transporter periplasmic adaptor subunit [Bacteroidota bacterium]
MKPKTLFILIFTLVVLAGIKIFFLSSKNEKPNEKNKPKTALVRAVIAKKQAMDNVVFSSGSLLANEEATLKSESSGKIISINFKEGQPVQQGQLLVKINDADLQANLSKQIAIQKINEIKEQNLKALLSIKGVSQEEYDVALSLVQQSKADVALTQAQIQKTEVRAPFDGIIGLKNVSVGDYVSSADVLASIQQINPMKIDFSIPERYASQIHLNDSVRIKTAGIGKLYQAQIYAIDPKIDDLTRSLRVRALIENKKQELFAGSYAEVSIVLHSENALVVPSVAVISSLRGQTTYIIKNGKAELNTITIGIRTDSSVEILSGVQAGDTLVTSGIMALKPGAEVKIQNLKNLN